MLNERRMNRNAKIIALFIMQYSFLIPVMQFINSTIVVGVFSMLLLTVLLFTNNLGSVNWRILAFYSLLVLLFAIKFFLGEATVSSIGFVVLFTLPAVCLMLFPFDYSVCIDCLVSISRISFCLICLIPFFFDYNYMRFGYGILPIVIMMYIDLVYRREKNGKKTKDLFRMIDIGILVIGFAEMLLYGARGCLVALIIFVAMDRILINKTHIIRNSILFLLVIIIILNIVPILDTVEKIAENLGIYSYSITKFKMQLAGGFEYAASGRVSIYNQSLERIQAHPFFGGMIDMDESGGDYAHNLFLQTAEDFGIPAMIILVLFIVYILIVIGQKRGTITEKSLLMLLFSMSIGRLLFSSTLWRRPEFWMLVCMIIALRKNRIKNENMSLLGLIDMK